MKLDKILVPLDGSMLAETALPAACGVAGTAGAAISLLRAAEATTLPGSDKIAAQVKAVQEAETYLAQVVERLKARGIDRVETHVWYGPAAASIVEAAAAQKIDLIVMGSRGLSTVGGLLLGSVSHKVVSLADCNVMTVRA